MMLATLFTGIVSNLAFEVRNGYYSLRQKIICTGPCLHIAPIQRYPTIFGILMILATLFNGIVPNLVFEVRKRYCSTKQKMGHVGPRLRIVPIYRTPRTVHYLPGLFQISHLKFVMDTTAYGRKLSVPVHVFV